jgi:hypothetical protein
MTTIIFINEESKYKYNCVLYARSKVPSLPFGLWTIKDKKKIINTQTSRVGAVAIMNVGLPWGHVGVVIDRTKSGKYKTIREANFKFCKITERTGKTADLKILGYYDPKKGGK